MWVVLAMGGSVALMVDDLAGSHRVAAVGAHRGCGCIAAMRLGMGACGLDVRAKERDEYLVDNGLSYSLLG